MNKRYISRATLPRRTALVTALAVGLGLTGVAYGQATTGSIFGTAPAVAGETVKVVSNQTGLTREVPVDSQGRYNVGNLPVGDYTVSLVSNGQVVSSQSHVQVSVSGGTKVPFAAAAAAGQNIQNLSGVTVTANEIPAIDVSSTRQTSVITAQQLKVLPLAHSAEAIALLAPGVSLGASTLGTSPTGAPLVSMGGNSVVENAYYLNGFNTTDPIGGAGGVALPYFAIAEQQTITSGYGPEYGRSTGGVISQIGKRGSNEFHAGAYVSYRPSFAESSADNVLYGNPRTPVGVVNNGYNPITGTFGPGKTYLAPSQGTTAYAPGYGQIQTGNKQNSDWSTVYDAYISGPLIKDKLFFFATAEWQHDSRQFGLANNGTSAVPPTGTADWKSEGFSSPKLYGKLDWNINDSNVLEFTGVQSKRQETGASYYQYNYTNQSVAGYYGPGVVSKDTFRIGLLKYTSYITDNLTLEAMYGVMTGQYYQSLAGVAAAPVSFQTGVNVPAGTVVPNFADGSIGHPDHSTKDANLRLDFDWKVTASHDLKFGIDNLQYRDDHDGSELLGGGSYLYLAPGSLPPSAGVAPYTNTPVPGNYVVQSLFGNNTTLAVRQKAQYVEDRWQVTPNLLLDLGLRNDQFENTGPGGEAYVKETSPQWAPRLAFSWDVFGDSTLKVFGNAGRYYLALPAGLAARNSAFGSINGAITYTYSGIGPTGLPINPVVVPVNLAPGVTTPGYYSSDGENGVPGNIKNYASTNLKPQYQDEYVLGFQKMLGNTGLVIGSQATWQKAGNLIDDTNLVACGGIGGALINPGKTNYIPQSCGLSEWNPHTGQGVFTNFLTSFPKPSRDYYALDTYLEHTWDGKWFGRIDYQFAKSYGSSEGPTNTGTGQVTNQTNGGFSGSTTAAWDYPDIMEFSNGEQANSRRHTIKMFGSYAITPEWMVSGTFIMQSGAPNICLSGYGPTNVADLYEGQPTPQSSYEHWCGGVPAGMSFQTTNQMVNGKLMPVPVGYGAVGSPPGSSGHTPWIHQLNLAVTYTPEWAGKHLSLQAEVHNVFNEQNATLYSGPINGYTTWSSGTVYNPVYHTATSTEAPRYVVFSAKYDF